MNKKQSPARIVSVSGLLKLSGRLCLGLFLDSLFLLRFGLGGALLFHFGMCGLRLLDALSELLETVNAAASIDELLLARIERMTLRADFRIDDGVGRARDEFVAADAGDLDFFVIGWVDADLHRGREKYVQRSLSCDLKIDKSRFLTYSRSALLRPRAGQYANHTYPSERPFLSLPCRARAGSGRNFS